MVLNDFFLFHFSWHSALSTQLATEQLLNRLSVIIQLRGFSFTYGKRALFAFFCFVIKKESKSIFFHLLIISLLSVLGLCFHFLHFYHYNSMLNQLFELHFLPYVLGGVGCHAQKCWRHWLRHSENTSFRSFSLIEL